MNDLGGYITLCVAGIAGGFLIRIIIDAFLTSVHREISGDWEGYRKRKEELDMISESCVAEAKQKTPTLPNKMTYEQTKRYHLMRCTKTGYIDELEVGKPCEITLDERLAYINHKLGNILKNAHTIEMLLGLMKEEE